MIDVLINLKFFYLFDLIETIKKEIFYLSDDFITREFPGLKK